MNKGPDSLMTVRDVMTRLNISRTTLWRLVKNREFNSIHIGEQLRFEKKDIEAYIRRKTTPAKMSRRSG